MTANHLNSRSTTTDNVDSGTLYHSTYDMALAALKSWSRDPELATRYGASMDVFELSRDGHATGINVSISHGQPAQHFVSHIRVNAKPGVIERSVWNVMALLLSIEPIAIDADTKQQVEVTPC